MALKGTVHYAVRGQVAVLTIDNPPVNPLSSGVRQGLFDGVTKALADGAVKAVVITGANRAFIARADISEFGASASEGAGLHEVLTKMENSTKPIVAAINGTAFGGGLEVALCCDYRVASPGAPVGLPEVKLGLLPGAGGTQRLPRLVGAQKALDFILSGDPVAAPQAKALGKASPGDIALAAQSASVLGLGFAFLLAIFPFYNWIPLLMEEAPPFIVGFLLWILPTMTLVFGMDFLDRYSWLRSTPQLLPPPCVSQVS